MPALPTDLVFAEVSADCTLWEGRIVHMYLDTVAKVTVGVGQMLPDAATAKKLAFVRRDTRAAATPAEIQRDFDAVSAMPKSLLAGSYKKATLLDLPEPAIDALLKATVDNFVAALTKRFAGWATLPSPAKRALMDMCFNLGPDGLVNKFPTMKQAVEKAKWDSAAKECLRNGISQQRNDWTRDLFLQCKG